MLKLKAKIISTINNILFGNKRPMQYAGIILGLIFFCIVEFCYSKTRLAIIFFIAFALLGQLKLRFKSVAAAGTLTTLWVLICAGILLLLPYYEIFYVETFKYMGIYTTTEIAMLNALLILTFIVLLFAITSSLRAAVITTSAGFSFIAVLNEYIWRFRGNELIFPDLLSANTAMNVADNYNLSLPSHSFWALSLLAFLLFFGFCFPDIRLKIRGRLVTLLATCILSAAFFNASKDLSCTTWSCDGTLTKGYYLNFYLSIRDGFVKKPDAYSVEFLDSLESSYSDTGSGGDSLPDIIVIMNEAFADMSVFSSKLDTNIPVTPFFDSLSENTIKGHALASVFGGSTANSEFEFLTGYTMGFLPSGCVPYQQYIYGGTNSLLWLLRDLGYECFATHPYMASGWNRPTVYPLMGFEDMTFIDVYPGEKMMRWFVSDQEMYEYVIDRLDNAQQPQFIFGITMQNHSDYGEIMESLGKKTVYLNGYSSSYTDAEEYLSLINHSDAALEYLISTLEKRERDTVVLFFGDHMPKLNQSFYNELLGKDFETVEEEMLKYTVPFFVWANYDIPEQTVELTGLNFLGNYLLDAAGIPRSPYWQLMKDIESAVPAINFRGYYSIEEESFIPIDEASGEEAKWLNIYQQLQYNGMFDKKKSTFFDLIPD